jgi:hypothetical protein
MQHDDPVAAHAAERDAQDNMHMDDINIPLVAVSVAFFGVLLAVSIVSLQAWFYHQQTAIREANVLPRDYYIAATDKEPEKSTELGKLWYRQRTELHDPAKADSREPKPAPGTTAPAPKKRISIDEAISSIVKEAK